MISWLLLVVVVLLSTSAPSLDATGEASSTLTPATTATTAPVATTSSTNINDELNKLHASTTTAATTATTTTTTTTITTTQVRRLIDSGDKNRRFDSNDNHETSGVNFTISPTIRLAVGELQGLPRSREPQESTKESTSISTSTPTSRQQLNLVNNINNSNSNQDGSNVNDLNEKLKHHKGPIYTNQFVIEVSGGEEEARKLAEKHGFIYLNHILGDFYHLEHRRLARRSIGAQAGSELSVSIEEEPQVLKLERQVLKRRVKRDFVDIQPPGDSRQQQHHQFGGHYLAPGYHQRPQFQQYSSNSNNNNHHATGASFGNGGGGGGAANIQLRPTQFQSFRPSEVSTNQQSPQFSRPANQAPNLHNAMSYSQRLYAPTTTVQSTGTSSHSQIKNGQLLMMQQQQQQYQRQYLHNRIGSHPTPATPTHGTTPASLAMDPLETSASSMASLNLVNLSNRQQQRPQHYANLTILSPGSASSLHTTTATIGNNNHNNLYQVYANQTAQVQPAPFNDPSWPLMWYLDQGAKNGFDLNVQAAWKMGFTGKGIVITILDDGLEKDHPDLQANYDPLASFDINDDDADPMPKYDANDSNRHGTRCAGEVAAVPDNNICSIGIAYNSKVGGVRMLDGEVTDAVEARSLGLNNQHIHIYSASWGPDDNGKTVDGPGELATRAFIEGVTKGRQGLGSIFVFASGNGGREHDNCNCDGYTNSIWTLSISSATENGLVPWYIEACSSTLATTYSSGNHDERQIATTDLHHTCTSNHTGTSASAPLAAGICALVLESNPRLTWRDMQHIVVRTARPANLLARDWRTNAMGRNVSHAFGYGLMDAAAMIQMAQRWKTMPIQYACEVVSPPMEKYIPAKGYIELKLRAGCANVRYLEHVQSKVTLTASRRGDLHIYLTSPLGTRSTLLAQRPNDQAEQGFRNWPFMTVHSWGEEPNGSWTLEVHNGGKPQNRAYLKNWTLVLYGTYEDPNKHLTVDSLDTMPLPPYATPAPPQRPAGPIGSSGGIPQPVQQGGRGNPSSPISPQRPVSASNLPPPPISLPGSAAPTSQPEQTKLASGVAQQHQYPHHHNQPPTHWIPGSPPPIPPPVDEDQRPPVSNMPTPTTTTTTPTSTPTTTTQQPPATSSSSSSSSSSYSTTFKTVVTTLSASNGPPTQSAGPTSQSPQQTMPTTSTTTQATSTNGNRVVPNDFEVVVAPPGDGQNQDKHKQELEHQTTTRPPLGESEVLWSTGGGSVTVNDVPTVVQPVRPMKQPPSNDYTSPVAPLKPPVGSSEGSGQVNTEATPNQHLAGYHPNQNQQQDTGLDLNQLDLKQNKDYRSSGGQLVILPSNSNQELDSNNLNGSPTPVTAKTTTPTGGLNTPPAPTNGLSSTMTNQIDGNPESTNPIQNQNPNNNIDNQRSSSSQRQRQGSSSAVSSTNIRYNDIILSNVNLLILLLTSAIINYKSTLLMS